MASEIIAGLGIFKSLLDMAKGMKDLNDAAVRNAAVIELQEKILTAREQQSALLERVSDLEKEMTRFETWDTEKQRYQLTDFGSGTFAYTLKPEAEGREPPHSICAACYQKGHKSILQNRGRRATGQDKHHCPACGQDFMLGSYQPQSQRRVINRGPFSC